MTGALFPYSPQTPETIFHIQISSYVFAIEIVHTTQQCFENVAIPALALYIIYCGLL